MDLLLVGVDLVKKCLLVIEIFVTILVHLRIVLPVILMHSFDILLSFQNGLADMGDPWFSNLSVTYARKAAPSLLSIVIGGILL